MIGQTLGHYRIETKLGEGGMGAVWKARDTRLDRFVALKTLPVEKLADEDRRRRFVQEAKSASALNHPNIVHIYDIADADAVPFIAMEYVAGKTLDQLIGRKGLRLSESLKYAVQIADALARAHSAGIIHRDLKPSNIMVDEHGLVKVLDFGLAKLTESAAGELGQTATMRAPEGPDTEQGTIVGTVAYMSPEQAEGKAVDARSDIFSFGSVLYEIVTGRRAFHGESKLSTLSAILKNEPKPVSGVVPDVPRDLEKIISRCLRKDPARRFQHMDDVKVALEELKEESDSGKLAGLAAIGAPAWRKSWLTWSGAIISVALLAFVGLQFLHPTPQPAAKVIPLTSYPGRQDCPALSPDGKQVAFAWDGEQGGNFDIYVKLVDAGSPLRLTSSPADEYSPAWSPDGRYIAFLRRSKADWEVLVMPALGGPERKLGNAAEFPLYTGTLSWSPDGKFLAITDRSSPKDLPSVYLLSVENGEKRKLTSPPADYDGDYQPTFSPDGKKLTFLRGRSAMSDEIYVLSIGSSGASDIRRLTFDDRLVWSCDWTADGRRIIFTSNRSGVNGLWIVPASGGRPERIAGTGENGTLLSVARSGRRLAYARSLGDLNIWRIPGPNSSEKRSMPAKWIASTQPDLEPQFSPDGKKIAFTSARSGNLELWTSDADGHNAVQLTALGGPPTGSPRWSPDGRWIAFDAPIGGKSDIYVVSADGGVPRRLNTGTSNDVRPSWSKDGRWIYFTSRRNDDWQIWKSPVQGGTALQVTTKGGYEAFESLDGAYVYYTKLQSAGIWRMPVRGGEEVRQLDKGAVGTWAITNEGLCAFDVNTPSVPVIRCYSVVTRQPTWSYVFPKGTNVESYTLPSTMLSVSPNGQWIIYAQLDVVGSDLVLVENFR